MQEQELLNVEEKMNILKNNYYDRYFYTSSQYDIYDNKVNNISVSSENEATLFYFG